MARVFALVATLPARRASCERLLVELHGQTLPPDGVILVLDGYGDAPTPKCPLPITFTHRTTAPCGPGARWRVADNLAPDDIIVNLDDDVLLAGVPDFVHQLLTTVKRYGGAAAAFGQTTHGRRAPPGVTSRGRLILACACGLAVRARHLAGLQALGEAVKAAGGPDALGFCGDDQALVSAHLWQQHVPIWHAPTGALSFAAGTQRDSQTRARQARGERTLFEQAQAIACITGWPWVEPMIESEEQPALSWDETLSSVPPGAARARTAAPPAGHRRVLVVDNKEPEHSGVYDVPALCSDPFSASA